MAQTYELGTKIYKIDSTGKTREWSINVEGNPLTGTPCDIVVTSSVMGSAKPVESRKTIYSGKNIGKANETTIYEQAESQALSEAESKLRGEYRFVLDENHQAQVLRSGISSPMLARVYDPLQKQKGKTLDQMKVRGKDAAIQPKFDGNRCMVKLTKTDTTFYTRTGDLMQAVPFISNELRKLYDNFAANIDEFLKNNLSKELTEQLLEFKESGVVTLDGEMYIHGVKVATISGLILREHHKRTDAQNEMYNRLKLHLYDAYLPVGYEDRYDFLQLFVTGISNPYVELTQNEYITATEEEIDKWLNVWFEKEGYEGVMLRFLDKEYEHKRTWQLCKYKVFQDAEYEVAEILEDARGGFIGGFMMKCEPYQNREGKWKDTFKVGVKDLTQEEGARILADKENYIGRQATIVFQDFSEYNVPVFGKLKCFIEE